MFIGKNLSNAPLVLPVIRRTLLQFCQRLVSINMIYTREDVFQLKLSELEQLERAWPPTQQQVNDLRSAIKRRGSPGMAEGPACIIHDTSEFGKLRSGDVLVAPYTNPSWTPLFQSAVAVVRIRVDGIHGLVRLV